MRKSRALGFVACQSLTAEGDLNNDLLPEIISLDMLPNDKEILKRSEGEDSYNIFKYKIRQGYSYQFARNNLQLNRNGLFSEMGMYAGVYATDWSWSPLMMDFDNDGKKDIFISNGIPKRMTTSTTFSLCRMKPFSKK